MNNPHYHGLLLPSRPAVMAMALTLVGSGIGHARGLKPQKVDQEPVYVSQVEISRTSFGVPHIRAETLGALGFGLAYCQLEDYGERVPVGLIRGRGELARYFGPDSLESDFGFRHRYRRATETYHLLSQDARDLYEGFAAGVNWYIQGHPEEFPDWFPHDFTGRDVHGRFILTLRQASVREFFEQRHAEPTDDSIDGEEGSNAWAFAPRRTKSGNAILLRNPHLRWDAGYYEAHLIVPGDINFYGDVRIGYPLFYIGGFNEHLGWATTNNGPDLDEIYALDVDPNRPDHYLFDGASVSVDREEVTVEFKNGAGVGLETRHMLTTPLGPVVHRGDGKIFVIRSSVHGQYRMVDQYLRMIRAKTLAEWLDAMRMRAHPSSNFTYADKQGNIFYLWNARLPDRPHDPDTSGAAVSASGTSDIWTDLVPFESLPQMQNPKGGYLHNENDPFYYANLNQPFDTLAYSANFPRPDLRLRSQLSLELIHETKDKLSLEDVVRLKHTPRMLLADRVKPDLIQAVRGTSPTPEVGAAIRLLEEWDNTTSPAARGALLFQTWFERYLVGDEPFTGQSFRAGWARAFADSWRSEAPTSTPRGLADPALAADAFVWAVDEMTRRYGRVDVAWGDVHRVRRGSVDVPVGGCSSWMGCFRTLSFEEAEDGMRMVTGGDAWVLAVEFGDVPRAYSVLGYGQSAREDSPHYSDQAEMFATGTLKRIAFTEEDIDASVIRRYRPGRER